MGYYYQRQNFNTSFFFRKTKPYDQMAGENTPAATPSTPPQYQKNIAMTRR